MVIGAGLSGLAAAKTLKAAGKNVLVLEASDGVGGRVRTDNLDGYQLDRGFQVLLTAYPETKRLLDYKRLNLQHFKPGAMILNDTGRTTIGDPLRDPLALLETLLSPAGSFVDKMRMLLLKIKLAGTTVDRIFEKPEISTLNYLLRAGFSPVMMAQFFRPFMTGIFLEDQLTTSSRMFEFVFKMFSEGNTSLPSAGMGQIALQLAEGLEPGELLLNERVTQLEGNRIQTASGKTYEPENILIATDLPNLPPPFTRKQIEAHSVMNLYFTSDIRPFSRPLIALNSRRNKLVNSIAVMNEIAPAYAPAGKNLLSVSIVGKYTSEEELLLPELAIKELSFWFSDAPAWKHLKTYNISYALPNDDKVVNSRNEADFRLNDFTFICGDHLLNGSINASLKSGTKGAEAIISR